MQTSCRFVLNTAKSASKDSLKAGLYPKGLQRMSDQSFLAPGHIFEASVTRPRKIQSFVVEDQLKLNTVLGLSGMELTFVTAAGMVLSFVLGVKAVLAHL